MYRIPTDDIRYGDWCEAIRPHVECRPPNERTYMHESF